VTTENGETDGCEAGTNERRITQERCKRIVFDVRHPTLLGTIHDGGTLAMGDVDQLEDEVRTILTRWGIAA
jgi:hypothetical protein